MVNLESHARRLATVWQQHATRDYPDTYIGTCRRMLIAITDEGRQPTLMELRLIAQQLDRLETAIDAQVKRLRNLTELVQEFAEAVNDAAADAQVEVLADQWKALDTGIDDEAIDRIAKFYTDQGHRI